MRVTKAEFDLTDAVDLADMTRMLAQRAPWSPGDRRAAVLGLSGPTPGQTHMTQKKLIMVPFCVTLSAIGS